MELYNADYRELTTTDWLNAKCIEAPSTELFYPSGEAGKNNLAQIKEAKSYCFNCPLIRACLELATDNKEEGIWGGTTERERKQLKKHRERILARAALPIFNDGIQVKKVS